MVEVADTDEMPFNLVRSTIKPKRERLNQCKADSLSPRPLTPSTGEIYPLPPPLEGTDTCEPISQDVNLGQSKIKEAPKPFEVRNPSQNSIFLFEESLEPPNPPEILNAFNARAKTEGLLKPTPVAISLRQKLEKDLNHEQLQFISFIDSCNAILLRDIRTKQLHLMKKDIFQGSSTVMDKQCLAPPNTPGLVMSSAQQTENAVVMVANATADENKLNIEEVSHSHPSDSETISFASNTSQEVGLKPPEFTMKEHKRYNYVMLASKENEAPKQFDGQNKTKVRPNIKEIPINESMTVGKMQVSKYGVYDCINLLISVLDVFDDKELLLLSDTACATSQISVEKNIMACINTLVSFGDQYEMDRFQIRANKHNIFIDAKERYNALFDSKRKKSQKPLKDLESDLEKPLPITIPDRTIKCPSPKSIKKNVGTQVKSTADIKKKPIPVPQITVTKPKCPTPCPSPYPPPKFNGKYKGGLKYCSINGPNPNPDSFTQLKDEESTSTDIVTPQTQDKCNSTEDMVNKTTPAYVNGYATNENADNRLNKTSLVTFSPMVSKRMRPLVKLPKLKKKFRDGSYSPYEPPKSMLPLGSTKSASTSHVRKIIPSYGEVEVDNLSVNSITTVTDDIVYTDFTRPKNSVEVKQQPNQTSPLYRIQNHAKTDVKISAFRSLLRKVAKPFKKYPKIEEKDIPLKSVEVKTGSGNKSTENDETKASGNDQLGVVGNKASSIDKLRVVGVKASDSDQLGVVGTKASNNDQRGLVGNKEVSSPSGRILKVPTTEECKRRNCNFQSWLDAKNDELQAKKSQTNLAGKKSCRGIYNLFIIFII